MTRRFLRSRSLEGEAFDMTPVIDVVFLLIIFFMLVCQFITAEYFRVEVPEQIASAAAPSADDRTLTLTILPDGPGTLYAVGPARLAADNPADLPALIAAAIDDHYRAAPPDHPRTVRLRCDKATNYGQVRPVLEGIAASSATNLDWAVRD
jgi:biopolymer transport protein ExbD